MSRWLLLLSLFLLCSLLSARAQEEAEEDEASSFDDPEALEHDPYYVDQSLEEEQDPAAFLPSISFLQKAFSQCSVDLNKLDSLINNGDNVLEEYFGGSVRQCVSRQAPYDIFVMTSALKDYTKCTKGAITDDLLPFLQNNVLSSDVDMIDTLIHCSRAMTTDEQQDSSLSRDICFNAIFGNHGLGTIFRELFANPDRQCPCISDLHTVIPECILNFDPLPIHGPALKAVACVAEQVVCNAMDTDYCQYELSVLNECMNENNDCQTIANDCKYRGSVLFAMSSNDLTGPPLPDACKRIAMSRPEWNAVAERYDGLREACMDDPNNNNLWHDILQLEQENMKKFENDENDNQAVVQEDQGNCNNQEDDECNDDDDKIFHLQAKSTTFWIVVIVASVAVALLTAMGRKETNYNPVTPVEV